MNDITIRYCEQTEGHYLNDPHGWYIGECPKCLERRLVEEIDTLREESKKRIADLEAQADDLEKLLKERMNDRG